MKTSGKVRGMGKYLCLLLAAAFLMTVVSVAGTPVFADETAPAERYQASADFSGTENPKPDSPWRWQFYDWDGEGGERARYVDLQYKKGNAFSDGNETISWVNHPVLSMWDGGGGDNGYDWGNCSVYLGAKLMQSDTANVVNGWQHNESEQWGDIRRDYPVRTFTAPETGTVKIGTAETMKTMAENVIKDENNQEIGRENVLNPGAMTNVRIMRLPVDGGEPVRVWPAAGWQGWQQVQGEYTFEEILVTLNKGDQLTFENAYKFKNIENFQYNEPINTRLLWDPVVEYVTVTDSYISSQYFGSENPKAPWAWQFYDFDGEGGESAKYKELKYIHEKAWTVGNTQSSIPAWINHPILSEWGGGGDIGYDWGSNSVYLGAKLMQTDTVNGWTFNDTEQYGKNIGRDYPVKTFTAPKAGTVKIGAAEALQTMKVDDTYKLTHIRIMKQPADGGNPEQVWPATDWKQVQGEYSFEDILVTLDADDKLTFENAYKYIPEIANTPADTKLVWDPKVEYVTVDNSYTSSQYFGGKNPNTPWAWQYYDPDKEGTEAEKYADLKYARADVWKLNGSQTTASAWMNRPIISIADGAEVGYEWGANAVSLGAKLMQADTNDGREYPVKTFTAPKSGFVTISAAEALQVAQNSTNIRICRIAKDGSVSQVWPTSGWQTITGTYTFEPLPFIAVAKGDKITFEDSSVDGAATMWDTKLSWDPVVTYTGAISFSNGGDTAENFADICKQGRVTAQLELGDAGDINSAVAFVAIYDENHVLSAIGTSTATIGTANQLGFSVSFDNSTALTKGSVKIFVFDSLSGLKPLSCSGSSDYIAAH